MNAVHIERLTESSIEVLFNLIQEKYPLTNEIAKEICTGNLPTKPCTQVYGCFRDTKLVAIMTATYYIVFPHEDGTRIVYISGAYTKESERHKRYATMLLNAIEEDAVNYFNADYICCDSQADELYLHNDFKLSNCTRLWKQL